MRTAKRVLVVGSRLGGPTLLNALGRMGWDCIVGHSLAEARQMLGQGRFDLTLSQLGLPDGSGSSLIGTVVDSGGELFLCMAVRDGCLWMPAVQGRRDCWGEPALRPSEFKKWLERGPAAEPSTEEELVNSLQMAASG